MPAKAAKSAKPGKPAKEAPARTNAQPKASAASDEQWRRFASAACEAGLAVPKDRRLIESLPRVFAASHFVAGACLNQPQLLTELHASGDLYQPRAADSFARLLAADVARAGDEQQLGTLLRCRRRRELVRIIWRDLAGWAPLDEAMGELSGLADACLQAALERLHGWLAERVEAPRHPDGSARQLIVIALGKLGARELNLSSDIDLMFAFPDAGLEAERADADIAQSEEFFTRLSRRLIQVIGKPTEEGFVFRVDMRLRPFGESGPLVMSCDATESYYDQQGREWERYALIKARVAAGDRQAGEQLLARLRPFVFRRYLDYGVFEALREMKRMIGQEVQRRGMAGNIKLGAGGIREIEFFGQAFQLIRGGVEPTLQQRPIRRVLRRLAEVGLIPAAVAEQLDAAYVFLRMVEHRLQALDDAQTHQLPEDEAGWLLLARSMGFSKPAAFQAELYRHRAVVRKHFSLLLSDDESGQEDGALDPALDALWAGAAESEEAEAGLVRLGYRQPREVLTQLGHLRQHSETRLLSPAGREKLDRLVPQLVRAAAAAPEAEACLNRLLELVATVARRTTYLSLLLEHPDALEHLVRLADASSWIVGFLAQHPVLLDELLDPRSLYAPPSRDERRQELHRRLQELTAEEQEFQIEALSVFKQAHILRVAAADVTGALPLMRTSDHLSEIAELVLAEVLAMAWHDIAARHGVPVCDLASDVAQGGFAVIAYGKLGGLELSYGSDLDLVFLHAGSAGAATRGGARSLDSPQFFARLGQRMVHLLTAHTRAGVLYDIDMRLRPSGAAGVLVSQIDAFRDYQLGSAWTWEHQALVRTRGVAGDPALLQRFDAIRHEVITRPRDGEALRREVAEMRERMRREHLGNDSRLFDIKQGLGGIVDIEFLVQYLVLAKAHELPQLARWSDNIRQLETLSATGILPPGDAAALRAAYLDLRAAVHRLGLQQRPALVPAGEFSAQRQTVQLLWRQWFGKDASASDRTVAH